MNIGIHLGSKNSSVSFFNISENQPKQLMENGTETTFPSVVSLEKRGQNDLTYITGKQAVCSNSVNKLTDSQKLIGKTYNEYLQMGSEKDEFTFNVMKDENNNCR